MESTVKSIINRAATINKYYSKIAEITGDNYNIFRILKVDTSEVRLHSAFLANLLDVKGSHGQGEIFLNIFVTIFKIENFDISKARTRIEEYAGKKTEEEGGRIDIIISSEGRNIIIENKIYAPDQDNQLLRYSKYPNLTLFYLTLYGNNASEKSIGKNSNVEYTPISYAIDIINWLEQCKKETVNQPILRETITQYMNLIKSLTNQSTNQQMKEDIVDIVLESDLNLKGFFELSKVNESIYKKILKKLETDIKDIAEDLGLMYWNSLNRNNKYSGFGFYKEKWGHLRIQFEFQGSQTQNLLFGFLLDRRFRTEPYEFRDKIIQKFTEKYGNKVIGNNNWLCFIFWDQYPYRNWNSDTYLKIYNGEMKTILKSKIEELVELTDSIYS